MKVGIISKPEHCKAHILELVKAGHDPVCLGASPLTVPDAIDLIVCRIVSCSHQGSETAFHYKRAGRNVLFEDGVTALLDHITSLEKPVTQKDGNLGNLENLSVTVPETVEKAMKACGVFCSRFYNMTPAQVVDLLTKHRFVHGQTQRDAARVAIENVQKRDYTSIRRLCREHNVEHAGKTGTMWYTVPGWFKHPASGDPPSFIEEPLLSTTRVTPDRVKELRQELSILAEKPANAVPIPGRRTVPPKAPAPQKAAPPAPQKAPPAKATPQTLPPEPTPRPVPLPTLVAAKSAPAPAAPTPASTPALTPAPAPVPITPTPALVKDEFDTLREAARLLLEEMQKLGFETITLTKNGSINYERVIVQKGGMIL